MGFLNNIFGSKPRVPTLPRVSLEQEQRNAINANLSTLPQAENLAGQANRFSRDQIQQMMRAVVPNYDAITANATSNIDSLLRGEIPQDVSDRVQNSAAARSLGAGTAGTGMARNLVARDLGLTSLDLTNKGLSAAESWLKMSDQIYSPGMLNLSSMFITPMQAYTAANEQNLQQFQRQWMGRQLDAMPDPVLSGINEQIYGLAQGFLGGMGSGMGGA